MREDAFGALLALSLNPRTLDSYVSYARRVEHVLGVDLDAIPLDEGGLAVIHRRLIASGMPERSAANCRTALSRYALLCAAPEAGVTAPCPEASPDRPIWMSEASVAELVRSYGHLLDELRQRGVLRTGNSPVGDYAEHLFARAFGWTLAGNSTGGHDAVDDAGLRYQIKARRLASIRTSRQLGALRGLDAAPFDHLAATLFDTDLTVLRAVIVPLSIVKQHSVFVPHTNSWRLMLSDTVASLSGVRDVTAIVRTTARS